MKIILDLCGGTGAWSKPYKDAGYIVYNITLPNYNILYTEIFDNSITFNPDGLTPSPIHLKLKDIYGILCAPPCTEFSFARTNAKRPRDLISGMGLVIMCLQIIWGCQRQIINDVTKKSPLKFWVLENPYYGMLRWFLGKPAFIFDPWEFGDAYKKRTALWGYFNLPVKTHITISDVMTKEQIEAHKTNSQKLPKFDKLLMPELKELKGANNSDYWKNTKLRQTLRAITPAGFARAFMEANP